MSWQYEIVSGKLRDPEGSVVGIGYSGAEGPDKNNPDSENKVAEGPIPHGTYTISGPPFDSKEHGPYVLRLTPDETTRLLILSYGREPDSFLMHGDSIKHPGGASEGCIIQDRLTRANVWKNIATDNQLEVVADITTEETT